MMANASVTTTFEVSAEIIWELISDFGSACQYLFPVVDCRVDGVGVGALRNLTNADGTTIIERLDELDDDARRLSYTLLSDTPFSNCQTTMQVRELAPSRAELTWTASFEPAGLPTGEAVEMIEAALLNDSLALRQRLTP